MTAQQRTRQFPVKDSFGLLSHVLLVVCCCSLFDILFPFLLKGFVEPPIVKVQRCSDDGDVCQGTSNVKEIVKRTPREFPLSGKDEESVLQTAKEPFHNHPCCFSAAFARETTRRLGTPGSPRYPLSASTVVLPSIWLTC